MPSNRRKLPMNPNSRRPMPVILTDQYAGSDAAKVDRQIQALQNSHSLCTIMCSDEYGLNSATTGANINFTFVNIVGSDDFASFAQQFNTFRVRSIRYDVYDINPSNAVTAVFATVHADGGALPSAFNNIIDRPDSQLIAPGTGKASFTWRPKGTLENEFQGTANYTDFGGLSTYLNAASAAGTKYQVIQKAIVDFRGRS